MIAGLHESIDAMEVEAAAEPKPFSSFTSGVALTFATRVLMLAAVVGSSVIVARRLGREGFGTLAVLNAIVALAVQIGSLGLPSANTYFIAKDRQSRAPVWANAMAFALVAGGLLAAAIVLLAKMKAGLFSGIAPNLLAIAALSIPFQLLTLLGLNVLLAMDRIGKMNFLDSMSPVIILVNAIVVLVLLQRKLTMLISFNTAAAILLSLALVLVIGRVMSRQEGDRNFRPDFALFKKMLPYGMKFYVSIMAGVVIFRADLLIVHYFRGDGEAGVYAVASQVSFLLLLAPGVIATLLFPRVASDQDQRGEFAVQVTRHASFAMLLMCAAAAAGSFALPLIYGAGFADSTIQLLILLPGVYLIAIESVLVQHFTGTGLPLPIPAFWVITLVVNLGLNFAFVPVFGARAAAVNSTISYALIFTLVAAYFCVKTGRRPSEFFLLRSEELRGLPARLRFRASAIKAHE